MPRYFFDTVRDGTATRDGVGVELPDDEATHRHVAEILPALARGDLPGGDVHDFECTARDDAGAGVYRAAMTWRGSRAPPGRP